MHQSVHILGAGGIGVAVAECLASAGWAVTMVEAHAQKTEAGRADGVTLDDLPARRLPFESFENWNPPPDTLVLLCTKTFDNLSILRRIRQPEMLVPIQNGYDPHLENLDHPCEAIASFVSACPANRPAARITRPGALHIGARRTVNSGQRERISELAHALTGGGIIRVHCVEDVRPFKATKLMYNAAISPLAASAGVDNAELLTDGLARRLFFALLQENYRILKRSGHALDRIGPFHPDTVMRILQTPLLPRIMGLFFQPSLRGTYCSMSPDIGSGRTEIDAYNGHLLRLAGASAAPINRAVVELVNSMSRDSLAPNRDYLKRIANQLSPGAW